jgi:predicted nucleic acid-binding protein
MQAVDRGEAALIVPTIVLAEALRISEKRNPAITFDEILGYIAAMRNALIVSLDMPIIEATRSLSPELEMHDRIIAATAKAHDASLLSRDRKLGDFVETVW